jgi:hypothetical protein
MFRLWFFSQHKSNCFVRKEHKFTGKGKNKQYEIGRMGYALYIYTHTHTHTHTHDMRLHSRLKRGKRGQFRKDADILQFMRQNVKATFIICARVVQEGRF